MTTTPPREQLPELIAKLERYRMSPVCDNGSELDLTLRDAVAALTAQALPAAPEPDHELPFGWIHRDLKAKGEDKLAEAVAFLIRSRACALEDAAWQANRRKEVEAAQQAAQAPAGWVSAASKAIEVLTTTAGNIRSLGPAGALEPWDNYLVWLDVVEKAAADLANALPQPPRPQEDAA